jgi:hypothetical protein
MSMGHFWCGFAFFFVLGLYLIDAMLWRAKRSRGNNRIAALEKIRDEIGHQRWQAVYHRDKAIRERDRANAMLRHLEDHLKQLKAVLEAEESAL